MTKDPRITAYALGEIGSPEREQFEQEMAESVLLQEEADAMLHLSKRLEASPKHAHRFDSATREKLIADFAKNQKARKTGRQSLIVVLSATLGVAAALVLFAGLISMVDHGPGPWANGAYYPNSASVVSAQSIGERAAISKRAASVPELKPDETSTRATYTVEKGDNIYTIARKFRVNPQDLIDANEIKDPQNLQIGRVLKIPSAEN